MVVVDRPARVDHRNATDHVMRPCARSATRPCLDESGAVLVFALGFMLVWSVVVFAILNLAGSGYQLAAGSHDRTERVYAAEAAIDTVTAALVVDDEQGCAAEEPATIVATLTFSGKQVAVGCTQYRGPNIRVADLVATVGGDDIIRARIAFDETVSPPDVDIWNWTVLR